MIVTVLAASLLLTATVSAGETMYVVNVADSVYLRNAPASSDYYTTVPLGAAVESVGWQRGWDGDGYNQVYYQGMSGWIKSIYLGYTSGGSVGGDVLYVSNVDAAVYLRNAPASSDYYTTVPLYAAVIGIGWQRGWDGAGYSQVIYNGQTGWIKSDYLSYTNVAVSTAARAMEIVRAQRRNVADYSLTVYDMGSYFKVDAEKYFYVGGYYEKDEYTCRVRKSDGLIYYEAG